MPTTTPQPDPRQRPIVQVALPRPIVAELDRRAQLLHRSRTAILIDLLACELSIRLDQDR